MLDYEISVYRTNPRHLVVQSKEQNNYFCVPYRETDLVINREGEREKKVTQCLTNVSLK